MSEQLPEISWKRIATLERQLAEAHDAMEKALIVELGLRAELKEAQGKLDAVGGYGEKLAKGHVSGTWQGLVKRELDRIMEGE